jgi:uncharacterized protein YjbJ (UPF0337 family)
MFCIEPTNRLARFVLVFDHGDRAMNKHQSEGTSKQIAGTARDIAGRVKGSMTEQAKGRVEKAAGKAQKKVGDYQARQPRRDDNDVDEDR